VITDPSAFFNEAAQGLEDETPGVFSNSEDALAVEFTARHGEDLRYVASWGRWLKWTGVLWRHENTLEVFDSARAIAREAAALVHENKPALAARIGSAATVAAIERLARSDRRHAATTNQWDADPWLLNTPGGIIDLRTSETLPPRREAYCTKSTAVTPGGDCPRWREFLKRVTEGDDELAGFLQRTAGYAVTGSTQEQCLFFLYGTGANGKSVFISTLAGIAGDYATTAPIETFTLTGGERHPTELAGLMGARLVTAVETEEGRRWNETRIKTLTGGDRIAARFMRGDFFEYVPQFKLVLAGNHRPSLRTVDEAIRRRMHLIPFGAFIPPEDRDPALLEKLKFEWPGILSWIIEGCLDWQRGGLRPPQRVLSATDEYLQSEDSLYQWLEERTVPDSQARTPVKDLYADWKSWTEARDEHPGMAKRFSQYLEARGFKRARGSNGTRVFEGLRLLEQGGISGVG
jgi:putative DNA primase/helicase